MISRYEIFCRVVEHSNITRAGEELGYSQSAVSQTIKGLERELGVTLLERRKDGIVLSGDGKEYYPYILQIRMAEQALRAKKEEMDGLENMQLRIGAFTSVTRNRLLPLMSEFKRHYPSVSFELLQGEYTSIEEWIREGVVDFGFIDLNAVSEYESLLLYREEMLAIFRPGHPFSGRSSVTLPEIAKEPFILLDEGNFSEPLLAFREAGVEPDIAYKVTDDYTILEMVRQGFGASMIYRPVLENGMAEDLLVLPVEPAPIRPVGIIWKNWNTMPLAAKRFVEYIGTYFKGVRTRYAR